MANLNLSWDNTLVAASANAVALRASKRIKAVGGAFSTAGFAPANDMAKTTNSAVATVTGNRVYEFKVEAICTIGGPTMNNGGLKEAIVFECIGAFESAGGGNPGDLVVRVVNFDVNAPDINKIIFELYDTTNTTLLDTSPAISTSATTQHTFVGLTPNGDYVVRVRYGAIVQGFQVYSFFSSETCKYAGLIAAGAGCRTYEIQGGPGLDIDGGDYQWTRCDGSLLTDTVLANQTKVVCAQPGTVIVDYPLDMEVVEIGPGCGLFVVKNQLSSATIVSVTPATYGTPVSGSMPLTSGQKMYAPHSGGSAPLSMTISGYTIPINVKIYINSVIFASTVINANGTHAIGTPVYLTDEYVLIETSH